MTHDLTHNPFRAEILASLERTRAHVAAVRAEPVAGRAAWRVPSTPGLHSPPVHLAGSELAVDVSDRQVVLWPLRLAGVVPVVVDVEVRWPGGVLRSAADDGATRRRLEVRPGAVDVVCTAEDGLRLTVGFAVAAHEPWLELAVDVVAPGGVDPSSVDVTVRCTWAWDMADGEPQDDESRDAGDGVLRTTTAPWPELTEWAHHSNSRLPDPPRPELDAAQLVVDVEGTSLAEVTDVARTLRLGALRVDTGRTATWRPWRGTGLRRVRLGLLAPGQAWPAASGPVGEAARRWAELSSRLALEVPDDGITRQVPFAVHHSVFSRSTEATGRSISLHGRPGMGFGDVAHLHQSYQMHLPALLLGESAAVAEEICAFLVLQDQTGSLTSAPRPGAGHHPYVGGYTDAHLLLAIDRYVRWTGDLELLAVVVDGAVDGCRATVLERGVACAELLLAARSEGLAHPCGWVDAWPPGVVAQGQVSLAVVEAFEAWARVLAAVDDTRGDRYAAAARELRAAVATSLYDPATGLVAEHLFADGSLGGRTVEDFWAHTQIWAGALGAVPDARGLDLVARHRYGHGVRILGPEALERDYLAAITDTDKDLDRSSTATWMLATWPEMTHHYALARLAHGDADGALAAVRDQLPATLHAGNVRVLPWMYAEKYLYPGDVPWLATWGGDPTLVEVLVSGFLGVRPETDRLVVRPVLPAAWRGHPLGVSLVWRGTELRIELDPGLVEGLVLVDGAQVADDGALPAALVTGARLDVRVGVG